MNRTTYFHPKVFRFLNIQVEQVSHSQNQRFAICTAISVDSWIVEMIGILCVPATLRIWGFCGTSLVSNDWITSNDCIRYVNEFHLLLMQNNFCRIFINIIVIDQLRNDVDIKEITSLLCNYLNIFILDKISTHSILSFNFNADIVSGGRLDGGLDVSLLVIRNHARCLGIERLVLFLHHLLRIPGQKLEIRVLLERVSERHCAGICYSPNGEWIRNAVILLVPKLNNQNTTRQTPAKTIIISCQTFTQSQLSKTKFGALFI